MMGRISIVTVVPVILALLVLFTAFVTARDIAYSSAPLVSGAASPFSAEFTERVHLPMISSYCLPFSPPSPPPSFFWATCFDSLDDVQNYHLDDQGRYSLIDDSTGSGRGKILKSESAPELAYFDPQYTPYGRTIVRSYPTMYFPQKYGRHLIGVDVYLEDDFSPAIQSTPDGPLLSLLSSFYDNAYGAGWIIGATADLKLVDEVYFLALHNVKGGAASTLPTAPPFTFGRWHRIEILVTEERVIELYQDGQLISIGELRDDIDVATGGGHPGLYGLSANGSYEPPFATGTLYNDNWTIAVWSP